MPYPSVERHSQCKPSHVEIEKLSYKLWQEAGEPHGLSMHFWLEAERQLEQTSGSGCIQQEKR